MPTLRFTQTIVIVFSFVLALASFSDSADAARPKHTAKVSKRQAISQYFQYAHGYSEFAIDAKTGKVITQKNASNPRYPASLTKMMTLYMTFEALQKGKLRLDQRLPVSIHASRQAPTNIDLRPGDRISVRDAIQSVVVRSANDSAVVLAEALGKSESNFAALMTTHARKMGMRNTTFRNASGLPNPGQVSTARDMALLGLALRRDFPTYFPYFKVQEFSFNGRTYTGHNRVINRFDGVDGIKTGYTNASGFNLVTSAKQGNHYVVAVIMGGKTATARDDQMVDLLQEAFAKLGSNPSPYMANRQRARAVPNETLDESREFEDSMEEQPSTPPATIATATPPAVVGSDNPPASGFGASVKAASKNTSNVASAITPPAPAIKIPGGPWGIQVGAFSEPESARLHAERAIVLAPSELLHASVAIIGDEGDSEGIYRARIIDLSEISARNACRSLIKSGQACFAFKAN